ncbi:MAG: response regulator, partial [Anaerolineae bacterium]|nr:response regulator [Anaerolineae bacterium]
MRMNHLEEQPMPEAEFVSHVADAYEHLYDLVYLRTHPLLDTLILSPLPAKKRARRLHHVLLDAIGELDPGPQAPITSPEWRRHRLMVLRYIKGLNPQAVADQLAISLRHYYRVHKTAIEDVAGLLWERYVIHRPAVTESESVAGREVAPNRLELLRLEVARAAQADRYARIGDVIQGVVSVLHRRLRERDLEIRSLLPPSLPGTSIDQSLLRQILLGMLGYLIEQARDATIQLTAQVEETQITISMRVDPTDIVQPVEQEEIEERLSAFEEMAALAEVHILPTYAGRCIVGFDLQLPIAERIVLVVDDNEDMLELIHSYLSPHGYRVITARTAQDGLDKAIRFRPYAITLDLMMPEQDGWDLLQALLNRPETCQIPVVICSVLKQKELALSLGATAFLAKPIT